MTQKLNQLQQAIREVCQELVSPYGDKIWEEAVRVGYHPVGQKKKRLHYQLEN